MDRVEGHELGISLRIDLNSPEKPELRFPSWGREKYCGALAHRAWPGSARTE